MELLIEEMRRVLVYCDYTANVWRGRIAQRTGTNNLLQSGLQAYALKQANMWSELGSRFAKLWYNPLIKHNKHIEWPSHYIDVGSKVVVSSKKTTFIGRLTITEAVNEQPFP